MINTRAVEIKDFYYSYPASGSSGENTKEDKKQIFSNFNLSIDSGEWVAVTGRSGCGKSTLICNLCGIAQKVERAAYSGEILLFSKDVRNYSRSELATTLGVVFQTPQNRIVAPTVEEEIFFGLQNLCIKREDIIKRTNRALEELGIESLKKQNPSTLSGGQQQLVSFAAVIAMEPKIYLLDEVMSQLDEDNRKTILDTLNNLQDKGATIIMVEHSKETSKAASRNVAIGGRV